MPTYEYECDICQVHFERKQKFDEEPAASCPKCQGKARRVIHSTPIIFKGSGFYVTDHRLSTGPAIGKDIKKKSKEISHGEKPGKRSSK